MSVQAITWALEEAPDVPPQLVSTLIALANHADRRGRCAYPSTETLTAYTRKSYRQVRRDLDELTQAGLIRPGNPAHVAHLRADRRPQVWDLAIERRPLRGATDDPPQRPYGGTPVTTREADRGDTDVLPQPGDGGSPMTERGVMGDRHGGSPMTPEPSLEPPMNQTPHGRPRAAGRAPAPARSRDAGTEYPIAADLDATATRHGGDSIVARWSDANPGVLTPQRRALGRAVDELLAQGALANLIPAALDEAHRPHWRDPIRSLPSAYDRARRDAHPSPAAPSRSTPREAATDRAQAEVAAAFEDAFGHDRNGLRALPGGG
ncbi:MAG: hypothetical protein GEU83_18235 [Pseudonocardiaceae bacterium]|nr:hypothetical protein [Pseudonocardiaceae bacterium]